MLQNPSQSVIHPPMGPPPQPSASFPSHPNSGPVHPAPSPATSQPLLSPTPPPPFSHPSYHDAICSHLFEVGFMKGFYADVSLHIPTLDPPKRFRLHSLILARSPLFHHLLSQQPPINNSGSNSGTNSASAAHNGNNNITLHLPDPYVTEEALFIALGHLYASYSQYRINTQNALNVFMTALHLQIEDLAYLTAEFIKSNINVETVLSVVGFITDYQQMEENMRFMRESAAMGHHLHLGHFHGSGGHLPQHGLPAPPFGPWNAFASQQVGKMSELCFDFLCKHGNKQLLGYLKSKGESVTRPTFGQDMTGVSSTSGTAGGSSSNSSGVGGSVEVHVGVSNGTEEGSSGVGEGDDTETNFHERLLDIYIHLPFEWLKRVIESKTFSLTVDLERYWLAKEIVGHRMEQLEKSGSSGIEESVVLAFGSFGGGEGSGRVAVVRKSPKNTTMRRERVLWKVPGL